MKKSVSKKASLGLFLIAGIILTTSVPVLAQAYKGDCKDSIEGDLDSCRILIENNNLYLKFKESELDKTIDLNRIINLQMTDWKGTNFWTGGAKLRKTFAISWNDGINSHITSFRLKPEDAISLMSFLGTKIGRSLNNEINNTEQAMNQIMADNRRRDQEMTQQVLNGYFESVNEQNRRQQEAIERQQRREHEQELAKIQSQQPQINNFLTPSNPWGISTTSRRYTCQKDSSNSFLFDRFQLVNVDTSKVFATNLTKIECQQAQSQLKQTGLACIVDKSSWGMTNYHLIEASGTIVGNNRNQSDCEQEMRRIN